MCLFILTNNCHGTQVPWPLKRHNFLVNTLMCDHRSRLSCDPATDRRKKHWCLPKRQTVVVVRGGEWNGLVSCGQVMWSQSRKSTAQLTDLDDRCEAMVCFSVMDHQISLSEILFLFYWQHLVYLLYWFSFRMFWKKAFRRCILFMTWVWVWIIKIIIMNVQ